MLEKFIISLCAEDLEIFSRHKITLRQFGFFKLGTMDVAVKQGEEEFK